jgi:hypothetical protein
MFGMFMTFALFSSCRRATCRSRCARLFPEYGSGGQIAADVCNMENDKYFDIVGKNDEA